jgi:mannose-6-phosphate isomerase-like protein (cupin superfamily)
MPLLSFRSLPDGTPSHKSRAGLGYTARVFHRFEVKPTPLATGKQVTSLARTDIAGVKVQVVASGGETNLHSHTGVDGVWFVLSGHARFYTTGDEVVAELGPREGIIVPRGTPYWFESTSAENLVLLQMTATAQDVDNQRVDHTDRGRPDLRAPAVVQQP